MARGHRLNTSIVLAAVHGPSGLFRAVSAVEPSLCRPLPTLSPSLIGHLASVDVKHQERKFLWTLSTMFPLLRRKRYVVLPVLILSNDGEVVGLWVVKGLNDCTGPEARL